jgi:hypothetical protein
MTPSKPVQSVASGNGAVVHDPTYSLPVPDAYDHGQQHGRTNARLDSLERSRSIHLKLLWLVGGAVVSLLAKWAAAALLGL